MSRPLGMEYPGAWYHIMNRGRRGESIFRKNAAYLHFIVPAGTQFGGDRQGIQYFPTQFGQQCCREDEREDTRGSPIGKLCRGDQNRLTDESSGDPFSGDTAAPVEPGP